MSTDSDFMGIILKNYQAHELREMNQPKVPTVIEVGTILCCQWGYEANNVDFYKVTKRTNKQITLVELEAELIKYDENCGCMNGDKWVAPSTKLKLKTERIYNPITEKLEVISSSIITLRRKIRIDYKDSECVNIESYSTARIWDGKPVLDYNHH